jgi:hypothetical protein
LWSSVALKAKGQFVTWRWVVGVATSSIHWNSSATVRSVQTRGLLGEPSASTNWPALLSTWGSGIWHTGCAVQRSAPAKAE